MPYLIVVWSSAALLMFAFGLAGAGLVAPFADRLRFPFLAAPLVGVTLLPLLANVVYAIAGLSYRTSLSVALTAAALILLSQRRRLSWRHGTVHLAVAAVAVSLLMLLLSDARSVLLGGPAIFFKYGTDQSGYAEMGDWLLRFPVGVRPVDDGGAWPYQSFPEILFNTDPRFGTFGLLAFVAAATETDSLFAYPLATAVVVGAGALSCSALFCRRWSSLLPCFACLLASQWVDYGYIGFLGRIVGYPSVLLLAGFALLAVTGSRARLAALAVMAGGAGTAYPGFVVGILTASILLPCVVLRRLTGDRTALSGDAVTAVVVAAAVPVLSSGTAARPVPVGQILQGLDWRTVLPRAFDLDDRSLPMTGFQPETMLMLTAASLVLAAALVAVALVRRQPDAAGFVVGPLAFVGALFVTGRTSTVPEFAGFPYPALVLGSVLLAGPCLLAGRGGGAAPITAWATLAVQAAIRLPRLYAVVSLFGYVPDPDYVLTQAEVKQIGREIGGRTFEIETGTDVGRALWLLSEFGRLEGQSRWAPDTWRAVLSYRPGWTYRAPATAPQSRLVEDLTGDVHHHFKLEEVTR